MALKVSQLLDILTEYYRDFQYIGSAETEIYSVRPWNEDAVCKSDALYVTDSVSFSGRLITEASILLVKASLWSEIYTKACDILADYYRKEDQTFHTICSCNSKSLDSIILDLLQHKPEFPALTKAHLKNLHWTEYSKYYVLAIDYGSAPSFPIFKSELTAIFHTPIFEYQNFYVQIIGCRNHEEVNCQNLSQLKNLLQKYQLRAGLSYAFFDITTLSDFFYQAVKSIELCSYYNLNIPLCKYDYILWSHLIHTYEKYETHSIKYFCHPILLEIEKYDQTHETEYLNTLAAYIYSGMSIQHASKLLYVHPNTLYTRIHKLEEIFDLTFKDVELNAKLLLSIYILGYLGIVDPNIWVQTFHNPTPDS